MLLLRALSSRTLNRNAVPDSALQVWIIIRMFFLVVLGVPLATVVAVAALALWLPFIPVWASLWCCWSSSFVEFIQMNLRIMVYIYGGPIAVAAAVASVCIDAALAAPAYLVAACMYARYRFHLSELDSDLHGYSFSHFKGNLYKLFRWYFLVLCIIVYAAPVCCIAAAAVACVLLIQIIAIPRTIMMYRDLQSLDFLIEDCRSLFELFVHIIGTIPVIVIAIATFPLVFSLLVMHVIEQVTVLHAAS
jgi:hypothetical protein